MLISTFHYYKLSPADEEYIKNWAAQRCRNGAVTTTKKVDEQSSDYNIHLEGCASEFVFCCIHGIPLRPEAVLTRNVIRHHRVN